MYELCERNDNTFYVLDDCPHALSLGIQVEEHGRPFIWFPGQLPYLVKADRASEIVHHVPESAKLYADRVEQYVPIITENIAVIAPGEVKGMPASSSSGSRPSEPPVEVEAAPTASDAPAHSPPSDLPRSRKGLKLKDELLPRFGVDDELARVEPAAPEPGDEPIDSSDTEEWKPSMRERLHLKHDL